MQAVQRFWIILKAPSRSGDLTATSSSIREWSMLVGKMMRASGKSQLNIRTQDVRSIVMS